MSDLLNDDDNTLDADPTLVHKGIDAETSDWPDALKDQDPGADADADERLDWYEQHKDTAEALAESEEEEEEGPDEEEIRAQQRDRFHYRL